MKPLVTFTIAEVDGVKAEYVDFNGFQLPALRISCRHPTVGKTEIYLTSQQAAVLNLVMERVYHYAKNRSEQR